MTNSEGRYQLSFFAEWEDSVIEGYFNTVDACYDRINNIGSRWIFYPNVLIFDTEAQETVAVFIEE